METLHSLTRRRQKNEALRLVREYTTMFPDSPYTRIQLESAAMRIVKKGDLRYEPNPNR